MTRIRNWPWAYIGRRWAFRAVALAVGIPWMVGFLVLFIACMAWGAGVFLRGGSYEATIDRLLFDRNSFMDRWMSAPDRLNRWAKDARPVGPDEFVGLLHLVNLNYSTLAQQMQQQQHIVSQQMMNQLLQGTPPGGGSYLLPSSYAGFNHAPTPQIPDDPNPVLIRGWRSYRLGAGVLQGMTDHCWAGANMEAQCYAHAFHGDVDVDGACEAHLRAGGCRCGIYVLKEYPDTGAAVVAEVVGWGAYVEYERGWRCQHVRIERLYVRDIASALREQYGVPVELVKED